MNPGIFSRIIIFFTAVALLVGGIGTTARRAFVGGTLSANPLSCVAGYHALLEAQRTDAAGVAGRAGDRLCKGLEAIINRLGLRR